MMDVSPRKRSKIITLHQFTSMTQRSIAAEVGVNQSSVCRIIARHVKSGKMSPTRKGKCGRKKKLTKREERMLLSENRQRPFMTSNQHKVSLNLDISTRTVRRVLFKNGMISRRPFKKQLLTPQMKKKRLAWAKHHRSSTVDQWRKVLFTDESHLIVQGSQSKFVRRACNEPL